MKTNKFNIVTHTSYWSYKNDNYRSSGLFNRLKYFLKIIINNIFLNKFGFAIVQKSSTFRGEQRSFINDLDVLSLRNNQIAECLLSFGQEYGIQFEMVKLQKAIERYEELFRSVTISNLSGGMGFNNGLFLYVLLCHFKPNTVLESGVWRGYSTFLIDRAIKQNSKIFCFDINLTNREFISEKATYYENEISHVNNLDFSSVDFAFFDDHVSIYDRLKLSLRNKIDIVVVDDDVSVSQVHSDGWPPIPTASMIYNYDKIPKKFEWINNGVQASADISNLTVNEICEYYRYIPFPQLTKYTGYVDTSFTSLLIKR